MRFNCNLHVEVMFIIEEIGKPKSRVAGPDDDRETSEVNHYLNIIVGYFEVNVKLGWRVIALHFSRITTSSKRLDYAT